MTMMTTDMQVKLRKSLITHEGFKTHPYLDTATPPKITIGIGYNLTDRGIDLDWINRQYTQDVEYFYNKLSEFEWFRNLNTDRQIVLVDMAFMGLKKFLEFTKMIKALEMGDFESAADEMLNSDWAKEVKQRALDLSLGLRTGVYNI